MLIFLVAIVSTGDNLYPEYSGTRDLGTYGQLKDHSASVLKGGRVRGEPGGGTLVQGEMDGQGMERLCTSWKRERTRDVRDGLGLPAQLGCVS